MSTVIIVLPGTSGSTLVDQKGNIVWPTKVAEECELHQPGVGATLLEDNTIQIGTVAGYNIANSGYNVLVNQLASKTNATAYWALPSQQSTNWGLALNASTNAVIGLPYDWRQTNTVSATLLQSFLKYISGIFGSGADIALVAHSMGGIVSRTYLETLGASDPWYKQITALITLGTPHLGAPLAFQAINGMLDLRTYLGALSIHNVPLNLAEFSKTVYYFTDNGYGGSTYQLLPPPPASIMPANVQSDVKFISDTVGGGSYGLLGSILPTNLANALQSAVVSGTWPNVSADCSTAAALLGQLAAAAYPNPLSNLPPYYCVYGISTAYPTSVGISYDSSKPGSPWFSNDQSGGGDQIVPAWSAMFTGRTIAGVYEASGANHLQLPGDAGVIAQVATWLGF